SAITFLRGRTLPRRVTRFAQQFDDHFFELSDGRIDPGMIRGTFNGLLAIHSDGKGDFEGAPLGPKFLQPRLWDTLQHVFEYFEVRDQARQVHLAGFVCADLTEHPFELTSIVFVHQNTVTTLAWGSRRSAPPI